jgi:glycosyltransferase involved in cell wall biosynthesis
LGPKGHTAQYRQRILFVCHDFPPHIYAGAQLYALNLAKALKNTGQVDVDVIYPEFWNEPTRYGLAEDRFDGVTVFRLIKEQTFAFEPSVRHPVVAGMFDQFLKDRRYTLVHVHELGQISAAPIEIAKKHSLPCMMTLHTTWLLCFFWFLTTPDQQCCSGPESVDKCTDCFLRYHPLPEHAADPRGMVAKFMTFRSRYFKRMFRLLDRRVAPSVYMQELYGHHGFSDIEVSPLGMPSTNSLPKKPASHLRFGFIGQVSKRKGVNILLEAFAGLSRAFPQAELRIHGNLKDRDFADHILARIEAIPGAHYFGAYTEKDVPSILSKIDVLVVPSFWENFPLVVQEAFQHKVPVIASRVAGFPEMVRHNENGMLFEVGNTTDLASQMELLCRRPETVARLSQSILPVKTFEQDSREYLERYECIAKQQR